MVVVIAKNNESPEKLLKRFKRLVEQEQILIDYKRHEFYEKPSEKKKRRERQRKKKLAKIRKKLQQGGI